MLSVVFAVDLLIQIIAVLFHNPKYISEISNVHRKLILNLNEKKQRYVFLFKRIYVLPPPIVVGIGRRRVLSVRLFDCNKEFVLK